MQDTRLPGITPGSGPGHLGLFGYDPLKYLIGRGALEATGIGFKLTAKDVAVRCNFTTLDAAGNIADRRAGRIASEESGPLAIRLREVKIPGVEIFVEPVKEHRFCVIFRGEGLGGNVADTDPQKTGVPPLDAYPHDAASQRTAEIAKEFVRQADKLLRPEESERPDDARLPPSPDLPSYEEVYGLRRRRSPSIPCTRGLPSSSGWNWSASRQTLNEAGRCAGEGMENYDFFFLHFKYTDSRGEDGDFAEKVKMIEQFDAMVPRVDGAETDGAGGHRRSQHPRQNESHSWHPVPVLIAGQNVRTDACQAFGESECLKGGLGQFQAMYLMPLLMAHADRLGKFGA